MAKDFEVGAMKSWLQMYERAYLTKITEELEYTLEMIDAFY